MRALTRQPGMPLTEWVRSIWYFESREMPHAMERILPNGTMQLLVNLDEDGLRWWSGGDLSARRLPGAALAGAFARPFTIDTVQQRMITGVTFRPGGASAFFRLSMREVANDHLAVKHLPGWGSIRDRLLEARSQSIGSLLRTWERFLLDRLDPSRAQGLAHARAQLEAGIGVQDLADQMSVSVRKLRQDFANAVGLSPKTYARVHRLQRLLGSIAAHKRKPNWASLAVQHGYFDQPHMIRDFRALTGVTPRNYLPRNADDRNHIVL